MSNYYKEVWIEAYDCALEDAIEAAEFGMNVFEKVFIERFHEYGGDFVQGENDKILCEVALEDYYERANKYRGL